MSRIEQLIGEIEEYIDSCKYQPLSNTKIIVNKEEMEELLVELRLRVPDEIKKYQKIISQQDAILADAKQQADSMLADARQQTAEMVSENEIMQQAYAKANELVQQAQAQADQILNSASQEANSVRMSAMDYTDQMLASVETLLSNSIRDQQQKFDDYINSVKGTYSIVSGNRRELQNSLRQSTASAPEAAEAAPEAPQDDIQA
ncbi:MAG TPA: vacuolar family H+-ATPase subunit H [Oribacterium sp.]|jgi:vacuolar-type H+-ATPase subunit H|nr:vacuolar family H+-ATPase subunit H [Oribacterium sp.]